MTNLEHYSNDELKSELERRQGTVKDDDEDTDIPPPEPLDNPDFSALIECVTEGLAQSISDKYEDDDFSHYVYEAAMEAVYGRGFWDWRNAQSW